MFRKAALLPALATFCVLGACDTPTDHDGSARLTVQLTDAPSDLVAAANVDIGRIELLPSNGAPITVVQDGGTYDLLQLRNGVTADLGSIDIEPGTYAELRMIVESAEITLKEGIQFADGSRTKSISVPSGAQTGIKIKLSSSGSAAEPGVEIRPGETVLVVDFDVSQNFVMQGQANTPAGIQGFLFTPTLRAVVRDVAGSIAGTVAAVDGVTVEGLSVIATRVGAGEDEMPATTLVAADGSFTVQFLPPGSYEVIVGNLPEGYTAEPVEVTVGEAEHVTGAELSVEAS